MSKPDINWEEIFSAANRWADGLRIGDDALDAIVTRLRDDAYEAGRRDVMTEGPTRAAMLEGAAYWLDAAQTSDGETGRVVARVVAQAFTERADRLRASPKPTLDEPTPEEPELAGESLEDGDRPLLGIAYDLDDSPRPLFT